MFYRSHRLHRQRSSARDLPLLAAFSEAILFWGMLALLALVQLSFGGVYIRSWYLTTVTATALTAIHLGGLLLSGLLEKQRSMPREFGFPRPLLVFILVLAGLPLLQLVPLPVALVELLSPNDHAAWQRLVENGIVPAMHWMPLSIDPTRTLSDVLKYAPALFFLYAACVTLRSTSRLRAFALFLVAMALFQSFYGASQTYGPQQRIWWWENTLHPGFVTGTYINRNHLAGFLELCIPISVALAVYYRRILLDRLDHGARKRHSLHARLAAGLVFAIPLILLCTLALTGSRAGIAGTLVTAVGIGAVSRMRWASMPTRRPLLLFAFLALSMLAYVGVEESLARFAAIDEMVRRVNIISSSLPLLASYPLLGSGLGTFNELYSTVALPFYAGSINLFYAHNDWLQLAIELGAAGLVCAAAICVLVIRETLSGLDAKHGFQRNMALAALFGFVAIAMHNLVDFNFHVPANLFAYAVAVGAALRIPQMLERNGHPRPQEGAGGGERVIRDETGERARRIALAAFVLLAGLALSWETGRRFEAEQLYPVYENMTVLRPVLPLERLKASLAVDPTDPNRIRELGKQYLFSCSGTSALDAYVSVRAEERFQAALARQPFSEENWLYYSLSLVQVPERLETSKKRLEDLESAVLRLAPRDPRILYLLSRAHYHLADQGLDPVRNAQQGFEFLRLAVAGSECYFDVEDWRQRIDDVRRRVADHAQIVELIAGARDERLRQYLTRQLKP